MNFEPFEITSMSLTNIETGEEYLNIPSPQLIDFTIEEKTNYATDKHNHKLISFVEEKTFTIDIDPVGSENLLKLVGVDLLTYEAPSDGRQQTHCSSWRRHRYDR